MLWICKEEKLISDAGILFHSVRKLHFNMDYSTLLQYCVFLDQEALKLFRIISVVIWEVGYTPGSFCVVFMVGDVMGHRSRSVSCLVDVPLLITTLPLRKSPSQAAHYRVIWPEVGGLISGLILRGQRIRGGLNSFKFRTCFRQIIYLKTYNTFSNFVASTYSFTFVCNTVEWNVFQTYIRGLLSSMLLRVVTSRKSEGLNLIAAEAWNFAAVKK
jgi:hypothetical protein